MNISINYKIPVCSEDCILYCNDAIIQAVESVSNIQYYQKIIIILILIYFFVMIVKLILLKIKNRNKND
jgi:hypothetical protein